MPAANALRYAKASAIVIAGTVVLVLWAYSVGYMTIDYDEIEHGHAAWLVGQGLIPYTDFFECHPPFIWYVYAPITWIFQDPPTLLLALRIFAATVTLYGLIVLVLLVRREVPRATLLAVSLSVAVVASHERVLMYLSEARIDPVATLVGLLGLFLAREERIPNEMRRFALAAFVVALGLALSPKGFALPPLFMLFLAIERRRLGRPLRPLFAGATVGAVLAAVVVLTLFAILRVDLKLMYELVFHYHWLVNEKGMYPHALWMKMLDKPDILYLTFFAWACFIVACVRQRRWPTPLEGAVLVSSVMVLYFGRIPYKQYWAPFYLQQVVFLPSIAAVLPSRRGISRFMIGLAGVALTSYFGWNTWQWIREQNGVELYAAEARAINAHAPPGSFIWGQPIFHPMNRRDVLYAWLRTDSPVGYSTEPILRDLAIPGISERFTRAYYDRELAEHPPAVIVMSTRALKQEPQVEAAIRAYIAAQMNNLVQVREGIWYDKRFGVP
jgi:hypothetical protein